MLERKKLFKPLENISAADVLRESMSHHHVTQNDLAERLGVSQKYISDLLHRKAFMNEVIAKRINKVMGLSATWLLNLDTNYRLRNTKDEEHLKTSNFMIPYSWVDCFED